MSHLEISEELHNNFHLFWDNFPFPVMMIQKDRTILDRNRAAEAMGCVPGTKCIDRGGRDAHKKCLANQALAEQASKRLVAYVEQMDMVLDTYWIPLPGIDDVFLHFSTDITPYIGAGLLPEACDGKQTHCGSCAAN